MSADTPQRSVKARLREVRATIIMDAAVDLFSWQAGYLHLYSQQEDKLIPLFTADTVNGKRQPVEPASFTMEPSPLMREVIDAATLKIHATAKVVGRTGVEMEALTAVSVAALTVYDMCKAVDRAITIERIRLEAKSGGKPVAFISAHYGSHSGNDIIGRGQ